MEAARGGGREGDVGGRDVGAREAGAREAAGREADVAPAPATERARVHAAGWTPADPGPLGLAAFAGTTFVLSMINANLVSSAALPVVFPLALAYGGIAQFVAGLWEFRTGNTFGAVAFCSYGAFWISYYFLAAHTAVPASNAHSAIGLYLWMWGIFTALLFIASLRTSAVVALVILLLAITFIILGIGNSALQGTTNLTNGTIKLGGWFGLATAIAAWYAVLAGVTNATFGKTLLPVVPLSRSHDTSHAANE